MKNKLMVNDDVVLLDGRWGKIIEKISDFYFKVETYDGDGNKTYFNIFYKDLRKR